MLGAQALSTSLSLLLEIGMPSIEEAVLANSGHLHDRLTAIDKLEVLSPQRTDYRSGIVNFRPTHADIDVLYKALRQRNIVCALRGGGIRWSPHFYLSRDKLDRAITILTDLLNA